MNSVVLMKTCLKRHKNLREDDNCHHQTPGGAQTPALLTSDLKTAVWCQEHLFLRDLKFIELFLKKDTTFSLLELIFCLHCGKADFTEEVQLFNCYKYLISQSYLFIQT